MEKNFERCQNENACENYRKLGRPTYLTYEEAKESGYCAACRTSSRAGVSSTPISGELPKIDMMVEAALKVDLNGDGRTEVFESVAERVTRKQFKTNFFSNATALKTVTSWEDLSKDAVDFNVEKKRWLTDNLPEETVALFSDALGDVLPSKSSPTPAHVVSRDASDKEGSVRLSNLFFSMAYQTGNFLMNGERFKWADASYQPPVFRFEILRGKKTESLVPHLKDDAVKTEDYNASGLLTKQECLDIFGDLTPDQLAMELSRLACLWADDDRESLECHREVAFMVGSDSLPKEIAMSGGHWASAIEAGLISARAFADHRRHTVCRVGKNFVGYLEEKVIEEKRFSTDEEAFSYLMSNPEELDDFLYDERAFDWLMTRRAEKMGKDSLPSESMQNSIKSAMRKTKIFTDLIDQRWKERYEAEGLKALVSRFGHPVGLPTEMITDHHVLYGGYLVEGGWLKIRNDREGSSSGFSINLPVDRESGRPDPTTKAWENVRGTLRLKNPEGSLERLGEMAAGLATAVEAWHVCYNRGLPRDSLYGAAALSVIDPHVNGNSYDDYSGSPRGLYHPRLRGVELAVGAAMHFFPTTRSKLSALARRLSEKEGVCPRGVMSLEEIDLANWRLTRFADNQMGNEWGQSKIKEGSQRPFNFDKLSRDYHERVQKKIRSYGVNDGLYTFAESPEDLVRPLLGDQRGEAMRLFVERPGAYLRRTGVGGRGIFEGAPKAVFEHIKNPLTPWIAYHDPALGQTTDMTTASNHAPATLSLNPYSLCAKASGTIYMGEPAELSAISFAKFLAVGPGRRGENAPRRLRFAATSIGEKAGENGLIDPRVLDEEGDLAATEVDSIHAHLEDRAFVTNDRPIYANVLTQAPWHKPRLFAKDFELGEMAETYKILSENERERKAYLQMLHNGKLAMRQALCSPGAEQMSLLQKGYTLPADSRLAFGDLAITGPTLIRNGSMPEVRGHGLTRGVPIVGRRSATFAAFFSSEKAEKGTGIHRDDDEIVSGEWFLLGSRHGHKVTGLEDTPIKYGEGPPKKGMVKYVDDWSKLVMLKGAKFEYEPAEFEGQPEVTRDNFRRLEKQIKKNVEASNMPEAYHLYGAEAAFSHQTIQQCSWEVSASQIWEDERVLLAAIDREDLQRQDVAKAGKAARKSLGKRESGYDEDFEENVKSYRKRGR